MDETNDARQDPGTYVSFHLNEIPGFVAGALQRLYGHIHASLPFIQVFKSTDRVSTCVVWDGYQPATVVLFRLGRRRLEVLNEKMQLDHRHLQTFAAHAFRQFPSLGVISFRSVQTNPGECTFPMQRERATENLVIALPDTADEYTQSLGKSTRRNIKRYVSKIERDFAAYRFEVYERDEIDEQLVNALIRMSKSRIASLNLKFTIDDRYAARIHALAKQCGVVGVIWIDGQLCAGAITYRLGRDQMAEIIANDPKYNDYWPGTLCYYLTICESIGKGVKRFHMGGGRYGYKLSLQGVPQELYHLHIYRSRLHVLLNADWFTKTALQSGIRFSKQWVFRNQQHPLIRPLLQPVYALRRRRQQE